MDGKNPFAKPLADISRDISTACAKAQRDTSAVQLIGVTKTVGPEAIETLIDAGIIHLAENRWQQARDKVVLDIATSATWHFIGRLQSNKVKYVVPQFDWIHSVDSLELAKEISKRAVKAGKTINCLIQVNVSGESSKAGIDTAEVEALLGQIRDLSGVSVRGLMTMAPHFDDSEKARPIFSGLRKCLEQARENLDWPEFTELSMGMSNDFTVAIEEGATMVRIGRRLMEAWSGSGEE